MAKTGEYIEPAMFFHPGETLSEKLQEMGLTNMEFSKATGLDVSIVNGITNCTIDVDSKTAEILERGTNIPKDFWLKKQNNFNRYRIETILKQLTRDVKKDLYGRKQSIKESEKELRRIVECL